MGLVVERSSTVEDPVAGGSKPQREPVARWLATAALMPLVLYAVLTPDWYSYQNGLDPYIYTGYARHLDDVLALVDDRHYILTRWPAYLPAHFLGGLVGDTPAYFVIRWLAGATVAGAVMALGWRRWSWGLSTLLAGLALVSPMTLRMLFTDYPDHVVLPVGCVLIVVCTAYPQRRWTAAVAGVCAAILVTCNPIAGSVVLASGVAWLVRISSWRARVISAAIAAGTAAAVLLAALVWFRWRYGIDNLYEPTFHYTRVAQQYSDPLRSRHHLWLAYRLWIYLPAVVLLAWGVMARRGVRFSAVEHGIFAITAMQYAFQWFYQFGRKGTTLELPYYWSYMVPALTLATIVLVARLCARARARDVVSGGVLLLMALAVLPSPAPTLIPIWFAGLAMLLVLLALLAWQPSGARGALALAVVVVFVGAQIGAPKGERIYPGEWRIDAAYDSVYDSDSPGVRGLEAATWFADEVDDSGVSVTRELYFWLGAGDAYRMSAMWFVTATDHWLNPGYAGLALSPESDARLRAGEVPYAALLGAPAEVDGMLSALTVMNLQVRVLFDEIAPSDGSTRAALVQLDP